jgi:hypothetical protein
LKNSSFQACKGIMYSLRTLPAKRYHPLPTSPSVKRQGRKTHLHRKKHTRLPSTKATNTLSTPIEIISKSLEPASATTPLCWITGTASLYGTVATTPLSAHCMSSDTFRIYSQELLIEVILPLEVAPMGLPQLYSPSS